jgi:hypothetical protein
MYPQKLEEVATGYAQQKKRKAGHKAPASTLSGADWKAATERIAGEFNGVGRGVLSGKKNFMRRFGSAWLEVSCG